MATWLGEDSDAVYYANVSATILATLRDRLYHSSGAFNGSFADGLVGPSADRLSQIDHRSMQATLFPMMAGVAELPDGTAIPGMGRAILAFLKATGMKCSCMAAFWLLEGLYRVGRTDPEAGGAAADHALAVLLSTEQFSWLNMISQGATCTMETWPGGIEPHSGGTGGTWSHPWCAGPNSAIIRLLLGVRPLQLGWARWELAPQLSTLTSVAATVPMVVAAAGMASVIAVNLTQVPQVEVSAVFNVPNGTAARLCLPPPAGLDSESAPHMEVNGQEVPAGGVVREGRMHCLASDLVGGRSYTSRRHV